MSGWWVTAKPGDKVVCIAKQEGIDALAARLGTNVPKSGGVYTVREIRDDAHLSRGKSSIVVLLDEVDNSAMIGRTGQGWRCYLEPGFLVHSFRPVQTKSTETGMAILKRILNSAPVREDA